MIRLVILCIILLNDKAGDFMYRKIFVNDKMQNTCYIISEEEGKNFAPDFQPELTPKEMLELGVFGGKYLNDCSKEFPLEWFQNAKLAYEIKIFHLITSK